MRMREDADGLRARRIKDGDFHAAEQLMEKYRESLFNFIFRMMFNYHAAEDIFQETWLRVIEKIDRYNPRYPFNFWLFRIARNICLDSLRKAKRRTMKQIFLASKTVELPNESELEKEKLKAILTRTSPKIREVIILRYFQQYDLAEISSILGAPIGTVKSRLNRGIGMIKKMWHEGRQNET